MLASFSVVPMGVTGGVKALVAEALKIVDESGLPYELGAMRTTIEGFGSVPWK
ncbi:MAG TPA: thiamine-binding protein [Acidobacteriaceae bacterium]|nr:thiamine-binding protein [Acidobacteriaceae bacterium]